MLELGKLSINVKSLLGMSEQSFNQLVKGVDIGMCRTKAWLLFQNESEKYKPKVKIKKEESPE